MSMMRSLSFILVFTITCFAGLVSAESPGPNQLSKSEQLAGWKLLFDGKTTKGWRNYKQDDVAAGWQVIEGALTRAGGDAGDIITTEQYEAFELSLEWKISKGGNSGLFFHVTETDSNAAWTGPEIQIQDNVDGHDPEKAGWLYQLYPAKMDATRPAGEWNYLHLRIHPDGSEIYMNGFKYPTFQKGSDDWNERVAKSKFAAFENFGKPTTGHICLQDHGNEVAYRSIKVRHLDASQPVGVIGPEEGALALQPVLAFPEITWEGWEPVDDEGRQVALRPIYVTNAGDGSNRIFVVEQHGVAYVIDPDQPQEAKIFLDIRPQTTYIDREFEEGLLGLAFHPSYEENGEFYIYYTDPPHQTVIARRRVSAGNPNLADAEFEEELLRIKQPFWNHNGGTLAFGPDGMLYIGLGDGGKANNIFKNAQNLETLLGSILRIDVDHRDEGKHYAVPKDNPFVNMDGARGEIWAYGLRNTWRLAFDRKTGALWCADVGQNLWEEINIITAGGNYGWSMREADKVFSAEGQDLRSDLIEPIFTYDHTAGKSITGGVVYRGERLPELQGAYLYGDFVSGKLWVLRYDAQANKVISNHTVASESLNVTGFGEDEAGEVYFTIVTPSGNGVYRFERIDDE